MIRPPPSPTLFPTPPLSLFFDAFPPFGGAARRRPRPGAACPSRGVLVLRPPVARAPFRHRQRRDAHLARRRREARRPGAKVLLRLLPFQGRRDVHRVGANPPRESRDGVDAYP